MRKKPRARQSDIVEERDLIKEKAFAKEREGRTNEQRPLEA